MERLSRAQAERPAAASVSVAGMKIVRLLVGAEPQSVAALGDAIGVTRTAVIEQLTDLEAAGFVERTRQRYPGRGRPRHVYMATPAALALLFASGQRLVVPAMWQAIAEIGGETLTGNILHRVSEKLAEYYSRRIRAQSPEERLREMTKLLNEEGGLVEVDGGTDGQLVMRRRSCPFISMFEEHRSVCSVDLEMLRLIVGAPVRQTACRHDGAPCCAFELVALGAAPGEGK